MKTIETFDDALYELRVARSQVGGERGERGERERDEKQKRERRERDEKQKRERDEREMGPTMIGGILCNMFQCCL